MALLLGLEWGGLGDCAGGSGEGHLHDSSELPVDVSPGKAGAAFGDAGETRGVSESQSDPKGSVFRVRRQPDLSP